MLMTIPTHQQPSFVTATMDAIEKLFNKHERDDELAANPGPLQKVGLTRSDVLRMTKDLNVEGQIREHLKEANGPVPSWVLCANLGLNPYQLGRIIARMVRNGDDIVTSMPSNGGERFKAYECK